MKPTGQQHAAVRNAADPQQVKHAARLERRRLQRKGAALTAVMKTYAGREFMWEHIGDCGVYASPFDNNGSRTYFNIGRSDVGRELIAQLVTTCPDEYLLMEREARAREATEQGEIDASHTARADTQEGTTNG
jgi:hypothetical protein